MPSTSCTKNWSYSKQIANWKHYRFDLCEKWASADTIQNHSQIASQEIWCNFSTLQQRNWNSIENENCFLCLFAFSFYEFSDACQSESIRCNNDVSRVRHESNRSIEKKLLFRAFVIIKNIKNSYNLNFVCFLLTQKNVRKYYSNWRYAYPVVELVPLNTNGTELITNAKKPKLRLLNKQIVCFFFSN